jgi:hypothetical protein
MVTVPSVPMALIFIYSLWGTVTKEEYMAKVDVHLMFICLHERILEMFICNCDRVRKDAERGPQMLLNNVMKEICKER